MKKKIIKMQTSEPCVDKNAVILEYYSRFEKKIRPFINGNGRIGWIIILLMQLQNNLNIKYVNVVDSKNYINGLEDYQWTGDLNKLKSIFKECKIDNINKGE